MKFRKKYCHKCKTEKEINLWGKNKSTEDGLATQCKTCMAKTSKSHYIKNKNRVLGKIRIYNQGVGKYKSIEKKYGIDKEQYLKMVDIAMGKCEICGEKFKQKEPYLDHCHKTNIIRGLLCNDCNVGLARFKDNPLLLEKAKEYLRGGKKMSKWRKKPVEIEATQWFKNGDHPGDNLITLTSKDGKPFLSEGRIVRYFHRPDVQGLSECKHCGKIMDEHGWIDTLEGGHIVCPGDWVITGVKGELYPCKPDIFEATYDKVKEG